MQTVSWNHIARDQPNSWEKMHDFTAEFLNVSNFTENSLKEFQKFAGNSRAPQTLFLGAALLLTKKFQNNEYLLH